MLKPDFSKYDLALIKDDKIIHASGKVRIDGLNKDGILNNGIISHKYHSTVRISEK